MKKFVDNSWKFMFKKKNDCCFFASLSTNYHEIVD